MITRIDASLIINHEGKWESENGARLMLMLDKALEDLSIAPDAVLDEVLHAHVHGSEGGFG